MCFWVVPPIPGLVELNVPPEIVAEGIGAIAIKNGRVTIYLYDEQLPLEADATDPMRVVTAKIVGELSNIPACVGQLAMCLVRRSAPGIVPDPEPTKGPRLVRT